MENKVVCYYCGTIYDSQEEKCPLCGGKAVASEEESYRPVQRQRITDQERKQRRREASKGGGKFAASNKKEDEEKAEPKSNSTKAMLIAALVFLSLAVVIVTWFIGDMIGWWGGIEDTVDRDSEVTQVELENEECTLLEVSHNQIRLDGIGQTAELKVTVNASCRKEIEITFPSANIVTSVSDSASEVNEDRKTDTWVLTAVADGTTQMSFSCGDLSAVCDIIVGENTQPSSSQNADSETEETNETDEPSESEEPAQPDEDFEPELNFEGDISLYQRGETVPLRVMNLPSGAKVTWTSSDITVAKVDDNGMLTAVNGGTATVTAEVYGKKVEILVRCPFDRSGDIGAHLEYTDVTIGVGESFNLYLLDNDGYRITDVTYEVSEEGICSIDDGEVTGLVGGDYITITVIYNTEKFECVVRVRW